MVTRVREHSNSAYAVFEHLNSCDACMTAYLVKDSFKIFDEGKSDFEITVKEALQIRHNKPALNKKLMIQGTSFILKIFG